MKKIIFLISLFCLNLNIVNAKDKITVEFSKCVDGDTAKVILNKEEITVRFLAIDTPESVHPTIGEEPFGKDASNFTCEKLKNAKKIELEYDSNSDKTDKYDRHLAWVFVDNYLLQDLLIKEGLTEVAYLYDDYKYTSTLQDHESVAKAKKIGIWNENTTILKADTDNKNNNKTEIKEYDSEFEEWLYTIVIPIGAIIYVLIKKRILPI